MIQLPRSARLELQPAGDRAKIGQARHDLLERRARGVGRGRGRQGIADVVRAARLQSTARSPSGHASVKRVANSPRSMPCMAFSAVKSALACTPKVTTRPRRATSRQ